MQLYITRYPKRKWSDGDVKISESYDAIEIREPWNFRDALPTWDCDSVVVLNSGVVVPQGVV